MTQFRASRKVPPEERLTAEASRRLRKLRGIRPARLAWPEGCYGSACSLLLFIGPSPSGNPKAGCKVSPRKSTRDGVLWNVPFDGACDPRPSLWGQKFRANIPHLVGTIIGIPFEEGSAKLFGFANFDWVPSPREPDVSAARMRRGERAVMNVLHKSRPAIIAPMTSATFLRVTKCLKSAGYVLQTPQVQKVRIRVDPKGLSYHRSMNAARLGGKGPLNGSVVVKLPQHPARMLYAGHGERCARAVRAAVLQMIEGREMLTVDEV